MNKIFALVFLSLFLSGCGLTMEERLNRQKLEIEYHANQVSSDTESIKKCREAGVGVYRGSYGYIFCDSR